MSALLPLKPEGLTTATETQRASNEGDFHPVMQYTKLIKTLQNSSHILWLFSNHNFQGLKNGPTTPTSGTCRDLAFNNQQQRNSYRYY